MKIVIANENAEFNPGVILGRNSVAFPEEVPLLFRNCVITRITNIRREGDQIVGEINDVELSAGVQQVVVNAGEDGMGLKEITSCVLRGVNIYPKPAERYVSTVGKELPNER